MDAQAARRKADSVIRKRAKNEQEKREAEVKKGKQQAKKDWPDTEKDILNRIAKASAAGERRTGKTWSNTVRGGILARRAEKFFKGKGYKVHLSWDSGRENMGDFGAPCMVSYNDVTLSVDW